MILANEKRDTISQAYPPFQPSLSSFYDGRTEWDEDTLSDWGRREQEVRHVGFYDHHMPSGGRSYTVLNREHSVATLTSYLTWSRVW